MTRFIYNVGVFFYSVGVQLASPFNAKASKRTKGYQQTFSYLKSIPKEKKRVWFHCASLGEFEQGRPLIEKFQNSDDWEVTVSFFSPSGYEIIEKKKLVEHIFYLMPDTKANAQKTIDELKPDLVLFVKYEFWANHIFQIKKRGLPLYCVSGIFREGQPYFKYSFFKKILESFDHLFIQNQKSAKLLDGIGITNYEITGDTRFDRVTEGVKKAERVEEVEKFLQGEKAFLVGSSWPDDEEHLFKLMNSDIFKHKCILAPHEIGEKHLKSIEEGISKKAIRYSEWIASKEKTAAEVLIIDNIGMLSNLYQYGDFAYVGGAFHGSLHNILEPAAFGLPVIFGPQFDKFPEGQTFIDNGIGKSITNSNELNEAYLTYNSDGSLKEKVTAFVQKNVGSSEKIMKHLEKHL